MHQGNCALYGDVRIKAVVKQNTLLDFAKEEFKETASRVKNLEEEKGEIEQEHATRMLQLAKDHQEQDIILIMATSTIIRR